MRCWRRWYRHLCRELSLRRPIFLGSNVGLPFCCPFDVSPGFIPLLVLSSASFSPPFLTEELFGRILPLSLGWTIHEANLFPPFQAPLSAVSAIPRYFIIFSSDDSFIYDELFSRLLRHLSRLLLFSFVCSSCAAPPLFLSLAVQTSAIGPPFPAVSVPRRNSSALLLPTVGLCLLASSNGGSIEALIHYHILSVSRERERGIHANYLGLCM